MKIGLSLSIVTILCVIIYAVILYSPLDVLSMEISNYSTYSLTTRKPEMQQFVNTNFNIVPPNDGSIVKINYICIELDPNAAPMKVSTNESTPAKRLVVYNSTKTGLHHLKASHSASAGFGGWDILYKKASVPNTHTLITQYPAYFAIPSSFGNLYHFWKDMFVGLFGALKHTKMLGRFNGSYLFYRGYNPQPKAWPWFLASYNKLRYQDMLFAIGIRAGFDVFFNTKPDTCFKTAFFGWRPVGTKEAVNYLIQRFASKSKIKCTPKHVVILERSNRLILNVQQLVDVIVKLGYNVERVYLEKLTFFEQYQLIRCTDILVGINGAGLQWAMFMRHKTGLMELELPFGTAYHSFKGYNGMIYDHLKATKAIPDWKTLAEFQQYGKPYTEEEKKVLLKRYPWKYADGTFDPEEFKNKFTKMTSKIFK